MSRLARTISESGVYHILFRGVNQQNIFEEDADFKKLRDTIARVKQDMNFEIYAYCFMSNHVHIVLDQYPLGYKSTVDGALATSYGYNLRNMLSSIETDTGLQTEYLYDPAGARVKKTVNGTSTSYVWNGSDMVYEKGENTAYYCYGDGILSMVNADGAYYHLKNGHGDVTQLTTSAGDVLEDYVYDAFGNQEDADYTMDNPFRYCGEYFDQESGFIYLRNRYYDSATGRFITEDPVKDGLNWYVYCGNNPVMMVDPLGLYDREVAVEFAKFYSINNYEYRQVFPRFKQDCTNFVSQCLRIGGVKQSDNWYFNGAISIYVPFTGYKAKGSYSLTWTVSNEQYEIFTNRSGQYTNQYSYGESICIHESKWIDEAITEHKIQPGDLLYFMDPNTGKMGHTAIIVSTENGQIMYAQHDSDKNNGNLGKYLDEHQGKNEFNYVFVVKIRDDA